MNLRIKSCVLLPAAGRRSQLFILIFTEPGVRGLAYVSLYHSVYMVELSRWICVAYLVSRITRQETILRSTKSLPPMLLANCNSCEFLWVIEHIIQKISSSGETIRTSLGRLSLLSRSLLADRQKCPRFCKPSEND